MSNAIFVGSVCEVLPAYSSESGCRDIFDSVTGCRADVLRIDSSGDVLVDVPAMGEHWLHIGRLKKLR
jgi:hypothetical protein